MISLGRRGLFTGLFAAIAAPAIVRIENIMPVRATIMPATIIHPIEARRWILPIGLRSWGWARNGRTMNGGPDGIILAHLRNFDAKLDRRGWEGGE